MKAELTLGGVVGLAAVGVVVLVYLKREAIAEAAGDAARAVGNAVNPASPENLAYRGVNGIGAAVTGDDSWNLGGAVWELFNDGPDINAPPPPPPPKPVSYTPGDWDFGGSFGYGMP
jgi:hypothetical protein